MRIAILPIVVPVAFGLLALEAWAFVRALKGNRVSLRHAIVLMACCLLLWLGLCFFFMVFATLGHSAHPLRDSWPQCVVSFFVVIIAPLVLFICSAKRSSGKDKL